MRILSKYMIRETVFPFVLSLLVISFMLLMNKALVLIDLVLKHGVSLGMVLELIVDLLPSTFAVTIPMSLLVAVMIALGRFSVDMELVAMKAGGISLWELFKPVLLLGALFSVAMLLFNESLLPRANQGYKTLFYEIISQRSSVAIQENSYSSDFENLIIRVGSKDAARDLLEDVTVIKLAKDKEPLQWIQAARGRLVSDKAKLRIYLILEDGQVQFLGSEGPDHLTTLFFKKSTVDLDIGGTLKQAQGEERQPQEMTVREIWTRLKAMPAADARRAHAAVEMHKKIAIPFACLAFMVIGFPLGVLVRKGGRLVSFILAIALIFVYYLFLSAGQTYGDDGKMLPWISMWLPNFVLAGLGVPLAWAALNEKRFFTPSQR